MENKRFWCEVFDLYSHYLIILALFTANLISMATATPTTPPTSHHNLFASEIFKAIATKRTQDNVIFSPASIQSCLTLAYLGAEGETAQQMHKALRLPTNLDKTGIAADYANFISKRFVDRQNEKADAPKLRLANRIYVNDCFQISSQYNELAKKSFDTEAVPTKFSDSNHVAKSINNWIESQTDGKIQNLVQPDALTSYTSAILINAIYFKAKWLTPFSQTSTRNSEFKMVDGKKAMIPMMSGDEHIKYGKLANLDASVIVLPYKDSDLSMMILLPNKVEGLQKLEEALALTDFNQIESQLRVQHVDIFLPKFRIEFSIDLKEPLRKLGLTDMFCDSADFSGLFTQKQSQKVDEVKHKAFIDVNEAGSEAAAATYMKIVPMSLNLDQKVFRADHPFVFAIRDKDAIYFVGHVAKF
ncbi:serine protease inhibitor 42Dd-like isoform X3 [Eurosta solidaginis]|uniref:serine protease inhibitor 42Dd-like isoform X3 n=1 Tax=Eurosta solidaginis TaxID=178769 RepID=UPI003531290B